MIEEHQQLLPMTWMTIGAVSFQLGERVVIVADGQEQPELTAATESLDLMVVDRHASRGIFRELMAAMVRTSIVQISFG